MQIEKSIHQTVIFVSEGKYLKPDKLVSFEEHLHSDSCKK